MTMFAYYTGDRLKKVTATRIKTERGCASCDGILLRLAERNLQIPYAWHPIGYICNKCNTMYRGEP
jgi:hypothetical protein